MPELLFATAPGLLAAFGELEMRLALGATALGGASQALKQPVAGLSYCLRFGGGFCATLPLESEAFWA